MYKSAKLVKDLRAGILVTVLASCCFAVSSGFAASATPGVFPAGSNPYGRSYGQWNADFWKWAISMPTTQNPLFDTADVGEGNSGHVWFIGGAFAVIANGDGSFSAVANRSVTIPPGTALFFPVLNSECSTLEGNGTTFADLSACADWSMDHVTDAFASIDGVPVADLLSYRTQSGLDTYGPLPEDDLFDAFGLDFATGATSDFVADGISLMVAPLSAGSHVIKFGGTLTFTQNPDGFDYVFHLDITYNITVKR